MRFREQKLRHSRWQDVGAFIRHPRKGSYLTMRRIIDIPAVTKYLYNRYDPSKPCELGVFLKHVREFHQVSLATICKETRLQHSYLEAIEKGEFHNLPGGIFNKSFVLMYAKALGLRETDIALFYEPVLSDRDGVVA